MPLLLARSDAEDEFAELAVEAATGGIPLAEEAGCLGLPEEYSLSIREDPPPVMPAPKPIERERIKGQIGTKEEREERKDIVGRCRRKDGGALVPMPIPFEVPLRVREVYLNNLLALLYLIYLPSTSFNIRQAAILLNVYSRRNLSYLASAFCAYLGKWFSRRAAIPPAAAP